jgi:hypothetical protein
VIEAGCKLALMKDEAVRMARRVRLALTVKPARRVTFCLMVKTALRFLPLRMRLGAKNDSKELRIVPCCLVRHFVL